jgi:aspartate carbamoyltransferase catalytic subunit
LVNHFQSDNLCRKRILIIGDVAHSRVAHSAIKLMQRMGAEITLLAPDVFRLKKSMGTARSIASFDDCDGDFNAIMCLRIQKERLAHDYGWSDEDYFFHYGLTKERFNSLGKGCVVLHPGPMNVGVEIDELVANSSSSLIEEQVKNGVLIRAVLIEHCIAEHGLLQQF